MIPYTDYECRLMLDELYEGVKVVLPSSIEHAEFMLVVAQNYINQAHANTLKALKHDYS